MISKDKDPTTGIVALTAARLGLPPGTVVKHYKHGDLYRILNLSRKEINPDEIEVCYFPLIPFCSPLMPWSFEGLMAMCPWHRSLTEFTGVVFAQDSEMRRYQPLPYQPESGWAFRSAGYVSRPISLNDAFDDLQRYLLNKESNERLQEQALQTLNDHQTVFTLYGGALEFGIVSLAYRIYVGRYEILVRLESEA